MAKQKNKKHILFRYGVITALMIVVCTGVVIMLFRTTVINADEWKKKADKSLQIIDTVEPVRGSILAANGSILACNVLVWDISIDLQHPSILKDELQGRTPWPAIDSLADYLDKYYPRPKDLATLPTDSATQCSWHARFRRHWALPPEKRNRNLILAKGVEKCVYDSLIKQPYLKNWEKRSSVPYKATSRYIRVQPHGAMAHYSIGMTNRVYSSPKKYSIHGWSGLEKDLDQWLYGQQGYFKKVMYTNRVGTWPTKEPVPGYDVLTTIDIGIQDILEQEMLAICEQYNAEWGTAIIIETATGEIKAISNLEKRRNGNGYGEAMNRIVERVEPGSVIKTLSLLIGFEDGLIKSNSDMIDCSTFHKAEDHAGGGMKSVPDVLAVSSNPGVGRIIFRGYGKDPSKYRDRWEALGVLDTMHSGLAGDNPPYIPSIRPFDYKGNRKTVAVQQLELVQQSFGYGLMISPLYLVSIYNMVANNGVYVRPHVMRGLRLPDGRDSLISHPLIRKNVCSERTARLIQECLVQVVQKGTARLLKDNKVPLAGKTGTAFPTVEGVRGYDKTRRRFAFAGYFPAQRPKYTCMVLMLVPGGGGAASTSGRVMANVANRMYARGMLEDACLNYADSRQGSIPVMAGGNDARLQAVKNTIGLPRTQKTAVKPLPANGTMPDLTGYDAMTAVEIMERRGIRVTMRGTGRVAYQSIRPGTPLKRGKAVVLALR